MPRKLKPCGTPGAAVRHKRRGEPVDKACREAYAKYNTERKRTAYHRARAMATEALIYRHRDEFRILMDRALAEIHHRPELLAPHPPGPRRIMRGPLHEEMTKWIAARPKGFTRKEVLEAFAHMGKEETVAQALQRMVTRGEVERTAPGRYVPGI